MHIAFLKNTCYSKITNKLQLAIKTITKANTYTLTIYIYKIALLDTMLYKDENNNIQTTLYRKPTDQQAFLHAKSEHPRSLKSSIPYSQVMRLKTICSTSTEFDKNCAIIKQKFLDRQYKEEVLDEQIKKVDRIERKELFTCK